VEKAGKRGAEIVTTASEKGREAAAKLEGALNEGALTTKIKSKLAAESPGTMARIKVDTDKDGVVWMSGEAKTQAEAQKAMDIAKGTEGVKSVKSDIKIQP